MLQQFTPTADSWNAVIATKWKAPGQQSVPPDETLIFPVVGFLMVNGKTLAMVAYHGSIRSLEDVRAWVVEYAGRSRANFAVSYSVTVELERV